MKKEFILILELKAEIGEQLKTAAANKEKTNHLKVLLKALLKHNRAIFNIYRLWLMADLTDGNQLFEMPEGMVKKTNEIELMKPVIEVLSSKSGTHFEEVLKMDYDSRFRYFEPIFSQFGTLKVTKTNFIEKEK